MDDARRFRFLVPPFFLLLSLAVNLYFCEFKIEDLLGEFSAPQLAVLGAITIGASLLPVGFLLSSVSLLGLHIFFNLPFIFRRIRYLRAKVDHAGQLKSYEAVLPEKTWGRIWPLLRTELRQEERWHLYAMTTFDHELLGSGIHQWIQRRWITFTISLHCCTAVVVTHLALFLPDNFCWTLQWQLMQFVLLVIFGVIAWIAWHHTMNMIEFQASRKTSVFQSRRPTIRRSLRATQARWNESKS